MSLIGDLASKAIGLDGLPSAITSITSTVGDVVKRFVPDPDKALEAKTAIEKSVNDTIAAKYEAMAKVMSDDSKSDSVITRLQRPVVVLWSLATITGLMALGAFGDAGPVIQALTQVPDQLWNLITYGVGIYAVGHSAETVTHAVVSAIKRR